MTPDPREEELRLRLRAAADEHRADRAAMLSRIERRRAESRSRAGLRPLAAAAAITAVMVAGVGGTWLVVGRGHSSQPDAASAPPPPPVVTSAPAPTPTASAAVPSEAAPSEAAPSRTAKPSETSQAQRWLTSDGVLDPHSNANWSQSTLTLANTAEITALDVTIRVAVTAGVRTTGSWTSVPNDKMELAVSERSGWLYYRFRLRPGVTMAPGSYVFAGQFNHAAGRRDLRNDTYLASASAGSRDAEVRGGFTAAR